MSSNIWNTEPDSEGWWWFYGRQEHDTEIELLTVKVVKTKTSLIWIAEGAFMYEAEGAKGFWQKIKEPLLPI